MGLDPSSPRRNRFYQALRGLNLPLLTHGGHSLLFDLMEVESHLAGTPFSATSLRDG
jgi:hypothetical protein